MKGKEGTGDRGGPDAKTGRYSSRSGLCPSGEKGFFADDFMVRGRVGSEEKVWSAQGDRLRVEDLG